ncbi:hypothetical protein A2U01_0076729, partial [Trifolium medium]|nr:hypothetical protein [Trifolium medium]
PQHTHPRRRRRTTLSIVTTVLSDRDYSATFIDRAFRSNATSATAPSSTVQLDSLPLLRS